MRVPWVLLSLLVLSACAGLPPAFTIASYALDGASYLITGKSVSDHALSALTGRDCAILRILTEQDIKALCRPREEGTAVAASEQAKPASFAAALTPWGSPGGASVVAAVNRPPKQPLGPPVVAAPAPAAGGAPSAWLPVSEELPDELPKEPPAPANVRGTFLVAGSFLVVENAVRLASRIEAFDVSLVPADINGQKFLRVVVGPFSAEEVGPTRTYLDATGAEAPWALTLCTEDLSMPPCEASVWQATVATGPQPAAAPHSHLID